MKETSNLNIPQYLEGISSKQWQRDQLLVLEPGDSVGIRQKQNRYPIRLNASLLILVLSGEITITADYLTHRLKKNTVIQLTSDNIIENITYTDSFKGYFLLISSELKSEIIARTASINLPKSNRLKRNYPIQELSEEECEDITGRIMRIKKYIADETHFYRSYMIRNEVCCLQMELGNIRQIKYGGKITKEPRKEIIREQFWELLLKKCKEHRDVGYYARELCVTPDYLSKIIRDYDGQSAIKWVANAVVTEAKILLRQPEKTINQIALELNFSDQSTFGKFFKRYTGESPKQFRNTL
ncbi:MAG: helix-turn-helix domain-containing protein [Bacteroidales bacterium]|jgi:AraC-like DNA-binding protein|nr:helix-turn-helix domain-containing protein [Bacteroidales bacterium]